MRAITLRFALAALLASSSLAHASPLAEAIDDDYPYLDALFRHLHANPELSLQEVETSNRLAHELEQLGFAVTRGIGGTGLVHLKTLSRLEYLGLRGTTVIDAALGDIASLTNLTGLHLGGTRVTDEGLSRLVTLSRVQQIWLHATRVSDVAIDSLLQFKQLRRVDLTETTVSEEGIRRLRTAFPDIIIER